ncbi:RDD family protein [Haloarcula marismortui]|uniref:RDD family protein n=3 Tax=Haloarcula marismortui TaxID=2238 RepID=A0A8T8KES5_9EURY|nr:MULTISPECIES: RDD family protein [Haloarcula]EMA15322.1 RDD domain-containing protein [Haloarcula californiae ATCC 33799]QUJ71432.1 RDD family protein [Haloarcula sinaiiensis ATCC 33800]
MAWFERPQPEMGTEGDVIWRRVVAIIIDIVVIGIVSSAIAGILSQIRLAALGSLIGLVLGFGYYIYLEGTYGQTIGKMALDIVVVTEDGDPIDFGPAAIRSLLRIVDVLPAFYLIGFVAVLVTDRKQRLGDIVADTVVVRAGETAGMR